MRTLVCPVCPILAIARLPILCSFLGWWRKLSWQAKLSLEYVVCAGTALAALPQMAAFVSRFPSLFTSCKEAVNWSIFAGLLCNKSSAAISIPSQLVKTTRGALPASHKGAEKGPPDEEVW